MEKHLQECSHVHIEPQKQRCIITGHWRMNDLRLRERCSCCRCNQADDELPPINPAPNIPDRPLTPWRPKKLATHMKICDTSDTDYICYIRNKNLKGGKRDECEVDEEPYNYGTVEEPTDYDYCEDVQKANAPCVCKYPFVFDNNHAFDRPINSRVCHKYVRPTFLHCSNRCGCTSCNHTKLCYEHLEACRKCPASKQTIQ